MVNISVIVSVLITLSIYAIEQSWGTLFEDYTWQDYEGSTPTYAFRAGLNKNGKPINVGQILYSDMLIPGEIYENSPYCYYEYAGAKNGTKNIKIFTTTSPAKFVWYPTRYDKITSLADKVLVVGGVENNHTVYIGRIFLDGETRVGKIACNPNSCRKMTIANPEGSYALFSEFELLTYNGSNKVN